jgi:hypothetical protein
MLRERALAPVAPEMVIAGSIITSPDGVKISRDAVVDQTIRTRDITPEQRAKLIRSVNAHVRRIKFRLYRDLLFLNVAKLLLQCRYLLTRFMSKLFC